GRQSLLQLTDSLNRAARFFYPDDVCAVSGQPSDGFHGDLDSASAGYAVENHRYSHGTGDRSIMAIEPFLRRLVIVGSDQESGIRAKPFRLSRQGNRLRGRI